MDAKLVNWWNDQDEKFYTATMVDEKTWDICCDFVLAVSVANALERFVSVTVQNMETDWAPLSIEIVETTIDELEKL